MRLFARLFAAVIVLLDAAGAMAGELDLSAVVAGEVRAFPHAPAFADQDDATLSPSLIFEPEAVWESESSADRFTFQPFFHADADDSNRTHADIRIANWLHRGDDWDLIAGIGKVFWGVTESRHLVDIVNQTDLVENIDGEDKLGQPMINLNRHTAIGTIGLFVLPGFRERTFPDARARLRGPLSVDSDLATYDASAGRGHVDFAARWGTNFGDWDVGLSHFYGTSREPRLIRTTKADGGVVLAPHYDLIQQTGLDLQNTTDALLSKLEVVTRTGHGDRFVAYVAGIEYTLYQIFDGDSDLGLLAEHQYDGRDESNAPATLNNNDLFVGARWTLNDTQDTSLLAGAVVDLEVGTQLFSIEAERRIGDRMKLELEGRFSANVASDDPAAGLRDDDSVTLRLSVYF